MVLACSAAKAAKALSMNMKLMDGTITEFLDQLKDKAYTLLSLSDFAHEVMRCWGLF